MRVIVTGSTEWVDRITVWCALNGDLSHGGSITLLHMSQNGAEDIADRWAFGMMQAGYNIGIETYQPDKRSYGRLALAEAAGRMVKAGANTLHAFPLEGDHSTRHVMELAHSNGIRVVNHGYPPYTEETKTP